MGERLKKLREQKNLTINKVVEKLSIEYYTDIDEKSIRRYERGEFLPKIDTLISLAELYGVSLDYIVYGRETSDDNSYTWYDTFKRLNRLIYSLAVGFGQVSTDGKIYLELWDDEAKIYYERLQAYSANLNYNFEHREGNPCFTVNDLDNLFADFQDDTRLLTPTKARYDKYLKSQNINPKEFFDNRIAEIKEKREENNKDF